MSGCADQSTGRPLRWDNINQPLHVDQEFTLFHALIMIYFDTFLYITIALYVDAVCPGKRGMPKPWYCPIQVCGHNILYSSIFHYYVTLYKL